MSDIRQDVAERLGDLLLGFYGEFRNAEGSYERSRVMDDYGDEIRALLRESEGREPDHVLNNCYLQARDGETLFNEDLRPTMDGYAIIPIEVYHALYGASGWPDENR